MGKSYLVDGALLRCDYGSVPGYLQVTTGHGYTAAGLKKANSTDCVPGRNIPYFGRCKSNKEGRLCSEYMKLHSKWENSGGFSWSLEKLNGEPALTMDSYLICTRGGTIRPETSGQGNVQKTDWTEFKRRFGSYLNSIFGFDPINLNTGNFIYTKEDLLIHGISKLHFCMTYNSMEEHEGGSIGEGWRHNYEISLSVRRRIEGDANRELFFQHLSH